MGRDRSCARSSGSPPPIAKHDLIIVSRSGLLVCTVTLSGLKADGILVNAVQEDECPEALSNAPKTASAYRIKVPQFLRHFTAHFDWLDGQSVAADDRRC